MEDICTDTIFAYVKKYNNGFMIYEGTIYNLVSSEFEYNFKYPFKDETCIFLLNAIKGGQVINICPSRYTKTQIKGKCSSVPVSIAFRIAGKYL